ncbi:MAG: hypothetical protein TU35_007535 [Thermoproteus sp. AZ2]|uniref:Uncharacterized protein n=1 Tax=Thermoproteus sp. AZ2 TaxID=1609232 RepID=A0ACC6V2A0_9CREN
MGLLKEVEREWLRFSRASARLWQRALSGSLSYVLWLMAAILAIAWYGALREGLGRDMFWSFLAFVLYSEPLWAAADARSHLRLGITEQILAARGGLAPTLFPWLFVDSAMWSMMDSSVLFAVFTAIFGPPAAAQPLLLAAALALLYLFSLSMGVIGVYLFLSLENPWIAALLLQLVIPLSGGVVPPYALPESVARFLAYSPFQYVVAPLIYAGVGKWLLPPPFELAVGYAEAGAFAALALLADRIAVEKIKLKPS